MAVQAADLEQVVAMALSLKPVDKIRLIERVATTLETDIAPPAVGDLQSLYGILAQYGSAPSADEIDETRKDMLRNFPREDI
jgi:hypothetical protein